MCGEMLSPWRCDHYDPDPDQFSLHAPAYHPWDYWVKMPLEVAMFIAVDVPCTLVANTVLLARELVKGACVAPFQQAAEPEVIQVNSEATKTKSVN